VIVTSVLLVAALALSDPGPSEAGAWIELEAQPSPGRIVVTVTTLEGTVEMPAVQVELRAEGDETILARTLTDNAGQVAFPDVPPGRYVVRANRPGFRQADSAVFEVQSNEATHVLLDTQLTFEMPRVEVRPDAPSATDSVQPVSLSDMLAGSVLESAPLQGDDFQSLLPLLPGVVRGADGRLRIKGGQPTQGALQVSSASLIDPSTGDFDLDLPGQSVESVEVLANPFAAEYGRFTTSVTQIRTRRGTNTWEINPGNLVPRLKKSLVGIRSFEPRFSARGPLKKDRLFLSQDLQFRYVATPVRSLADEPEIELRSFDAFTRFDAVISARHMFGGGAITFPREITRGTMNTFRPPAVTPRFTQGGLTAGVVDRLALAEDVVLETTVSGRWFEIEVRPEAVGSMVFAPESQTGRYFNHHERKVSGIQWVEALSVSRRLWTGQHVFKMGVDVQQSRFSGFSESQPVEIRRTDGSLAELITFGNRTTQQVDGTEVAFFVQDRWRIGSRITFELGLRLDRDGVIRHSNVSPRAGVAIGILPEGRGILRGGFGNFVQRTPLNIGAFADFEPRVVSRFSAGGSPLGPTIRYRHVADAGLETPEADVVNVEWNQRFGRRVLLKLAAIHRNGVHELILVPDPASSLIRLSGSGTSRYDELETTARYLRGDRRDITVSYVWSKGEADLNNYDHFYGNLRDPILRANEKSLVPTDVRHRVLIRGMIGLPGRWDLAPVIELRSGFPWSAVDEFQDFVGVRNTTGRLPAVRTVDLAISRPWRFKKHRFRAGVKFYNLLGSDAGRDIQHNITSPFYGTAYNPIERSIGFTVGTSR
jgi:hypothetical protein